MIKRAEHIMWFILFADLVIAALFVTPLQSLPYSSDVLLTAFITAWPSSLLLLRYVRKGKLLTHPNLVGPVLMILAVSAICLVLNYYLLLTGTAFVASWGFFLTVFVASGFRLFKAVHTRKSD